MQTQNKGGDVQESLTNILNHVSQNPGSKVVENIVKLALKENASNTLQQNQVTPQLPNDFSNRNDPMVSDKALEVDPNAMDALSNKGDALYDLERYDEAIQYYDKAQAIDPNEIYALESKNTALKELDK